MALAPGSSGSDAELSAESVELLPPSADEGAPAALSTQPAADAPKQSISAGMSTPEVAGPQGSEPREVEPEAVMMMADSTEHALGAAPPPPLRAAAVGTTPPPVPPEVAAGTAPKAATVEKAAAHSPADASQTAARSREVPGAAVVPARKLPAAPAAPPASPIIAATLFDEFQTPSSGADAVPEALARRSLQKRSKPWYEEVFDDDYLRTVPFMTPDQTAREIDFIRKSLSLRSGAEVLDVGCGYGRHAVELAQQGFHVTGLDLSLPLLIKAADHAQKRGLAVNFVNADMREMTFNAQFDAAYCVLSSFGYFDEETNLRVATAVCRALKPGGKFLLDILNRDYVVGGLPSRVWWEGDGCVVLEEVDFNYHTSRVLIRRSVVFGSGRQSEQELSMRAYSLHEVGRLLRQAGLRVLEVSGGLSTKSRFFGAASRNIIAVCERPVP